MAFFCLALVHITFSFWEDRKIKTTFPPKHAVSLNYCELDLSGIANLGVFGDYSHA